MDPIPVVLLSKIKWGHSHQPLPHTALPESNSMAGAIARIALSKGLKSVETTLIGKI